MKRSHVMTISQTTAEDLLARRITEFRVLSTPRSREWVCDLERVQAVLMLYKRLVDRALSGRANASAIKDELDAIAAELVAQAEYARGPG